MTVSVISSDPPCKERNARFTIISFKPLTHHGGRKTPSIYLLNNFQTETLACMLVHSVM